MQHLHLKNYDNVSRDINIYDSDLKGGFRVAHRVCSGRALYLLSLLQDTDINALQ
jgi:hypothetical protein